ncbi:MAG: tripartite tricarboxylate transporter substrate binding protein [Hyphomicrobiales bacterium]|nr:tripartite tricarboxylate transporter substrate binding protein [Hyphomicrobiales bacterium]
MGFSRRTMLQFAAGVITLAPWSRSTHAQVYPTRPIRWIVAGAPGNTTDIIARLIGQRLTERLGQPVVIENRPGAGGNIGTEAAVRASADGYTLLLIGSPQVINTTLYDKLSFNLLRDIAPVASIARTPNVMAVNLQFPATTVAEFVAHAKAHPGKINFGSPGIGTSNHISGELFKMMTGTEMVHVPYRATQAALTDLISGQIQVVFDNLPTSIGYIRDGKLRPLAVTSATRWEGLPDIPTVGEFVPGFEASGFGGVGVPAGTPREIIARLNTEINAALADPRITTRLTELGTSGFALSPADYGRLLAAEVEKWGKAVRFSGAKAE